MNLLNIQDWDWDTDLLEATAPELIKRLPKVAQVALRLRASPITLFKNTVLPKHTNHHLHGRQP